MTQNTQGWNEFYGLSLERGYVIVPNLLLRINNYLAKPNKLKPTELCLLLALLSHCHKPQFSKRDVGRVFPSQKTLAAEIGASESTVKRSLEKLEKAGWIRRKTCEKGRNDSFDLRAIPYKLKAIHAEMKVSYRQKVKPDFSNSLNRELDYDPEEEF